MARHEANDHLSGYQPYEERVRPVVIFTLVLTVGTLAVLGLMKLAHDSFEKEIREASKPIHPLAAERETPPEPRLQANPAIDLDAFRARESDRLSTYGWVDRQAGVVHVPIERAMELVAKDGLPVREGGGR
ncbi:MAG: hypothetical protein ACKVXR_08030 [Planctomycetota bacterium]